MRKFMTVVLAVMALTALAGCASIPYSGSVHEGVQAQTPVNEDLQFLPSGPAKNADAEQILRGFVDAATSPVNDWGIARQFLAAPVSSKWVPAHQVFIDEGNRTVQKINESTYVLQTTVTGVLNDQGAYTAQAPTLEKFPFTFTQVNGQWRIQGLADGIILDSGIFQQTYSEISLYFYDSNLSTLVPDLRWFPARSSTSTRVVKALLAGPVSWMSAAHAVRSAFPADTTLVAESVPLEGGIAKVDIDVKSLDADSVTRNRMLSQLAASLAGVPGVTKVTMSFSGAPIGEAPVPALSSLQTDTALTDPVVVTDRSYASIGANGAQSLATMQGPVLALKPTAVAVSEGRDITAVLNTSGVTVVTSRGDMRLIDARKALIPPVLDRSNFVWTVPSESPTQIRATSVDGNAASIQVPWSADQTISSLSVSSDGTRIAAVLQKGGVGHLCIAGIERKASGTPISVGTCIYPRLNNNGVRLGGWIDQTHVAVTAPTGSADVLILITVGGMTARVPLPAHAVTITGSGAYGVPRVLTTSGEVLQQVAGTRWYALIDQVRALAVVG